jgi:hypothetical protein
MIGGLKMRNNLKSILCLFLSSQLIFQYSGCTLIGLGVGAIRDSRKPDFQSKPVEDSLKLKKGNQMILILRDGRKLTGKYIELDKLPYTEYLNRYHEFRNKETNASVLPLLGKITATLKTTKEKVDIELTGFDYDGLWLKKIEWPNPIKHPYDLFFAIVDKQGKKFNENAIDNIKSMSSNIELPIVSAIKIEILSDEQLVALNDLSEIRLHPKKHDKYYGLLLGVITDMLIVYAIGQSMPDCWICEGDLRWD